uniref:Uncharacterized protein n=1 Tax=Populus alba TaxID=43335 RepID=A0A4U5QQB1_POPAL|nr:hypothetical protein D5086_0000072090 [Populus alba]
MRMFVSRHVIFDEHQFPYSDLVSTPSNTLPSSPLSSCPVIVVNPENSIVSTSSASPSHPSPTHTPAPSTDSVSPQSITAPLSASPLLPVAPDISMQSDLDSHGFIPDNLQVVLSIPPLNLHPMQTRSKSGIIKRKALLAIIHVPKAPDIQLVEPPNYKAALKIPGEIYAEMLSVVLLIVEDCQEALIHGMGCVVTLNI